ncbi:MAG: GTP cyclohydrolase II [Deltaproteobacteria bacterium]|nr:GTP cyclohydrolase II [Deltaproteobacteria bacterium]
MHVPAGRHAQGPIRPHLHVVASSAVPTEFGTFTMHVFRWTGGDHEADLANGLSPDHVAITMGDLDDAEGVLIRVHSECLTSEVFGSLKCDCRKQLVAAQRAIAEAGRGAIFYLRQEGRGIGLANKIRAYELQSLGHDTVDANRLLGLPDDTRDYAPAAAMIDHLGIESVRLLTNNPLKVEALRSLGVKVERRELVCSTNPWSAAYLEAKRDRMGHFLPQALPAEESHAHFPVGDAE